MVAKRINGWTAKGDEYGIEGGQSYIKENGCYHIIFDTTNRVHELWAIPAKDLSLEELIHKLEGPFEKQEKGPFGRNFLEEYGTKPIFQSRLPPR